MPDGTIIDANDHFLSAVGYGLDDIKGKHHRMFMDPVAADKPAYRTFWDQLAKGEISSGEYERVTRTGQRIWISARYTPIRDAQNNVTQIIKFATDVIARHQATASLIDALGVLAKGDLSVRLKVSEGDVDKEIRHSFSGTVARLGEVIKGIIGGTDTLDGVTQSLGTLSRHLMQETTQQATLLGGINATVSHISGQLRATNASVAQLDAEAGLSARQSKEGAAIVAQAITAIHGIQALARQVSQNTQVIENFAFQTNLLSLNAAVEAARAGPAGLGFAVVASEVRALSNKSSEASMVIADLTRRCEQEVTEGTKLIETAGAALVEIEMAATAVAAGTATIAEASRRQSEGVAQVEGSRGQIDVSVRGVKGLSRDGNVQAERLQAEAAQLRQLIQAFLLDSTAGKAPSGGHGGGHGGGHQARGAALRQVG